MTDEHDATAAGGRDLEAVYSFGDAARALRVAALLGNATGSADFASGAASAQTLRMILATDSPGVASMSSMDASLDSIDAKLVQFILNFGSAAAAARVAALIGNANGVADFGNGAISTQTLRVLLASDAALPAGTNFLGTVGGNIADVAMSELTRPANATAYAANDAVSNSTTAPVAFTFTDLARLNGGAGYITKARLMTNQSGNTARFRLHLFTISPTAINDNEPYTLLYANFASRIGTVEFPACSTSGSGSTAAKAESPDIRILYKCESDSRTVYGLLEVLDAFTPASEQKFQIKLSADNY